jgi:hypothetical protein
VSAAQRTKAKKISDFEEAGKVMINLWKNRFNRKMEVAYAQAIFYHV